MGSVIVFVTLAFAALKLALAFEVQFPSPSNYWVSCQNNVLQWTSRDGDPDIFSVALLNANLTLVNGNYQIANSLRTANGTAIVNPNCVQPGESYTVAFVNASQYSYNKPQIFYTSPAFTIEQKNATVQVPKGFKLTHNGTQLEQSNDASATSSTTEPPAPVFSGGPASSGASYPGKVEKPNTGNALKLIIVNIVATTMAAAIVATLL